MAKNHMAQFRVEPRKRVQLAQRDPRDASAFPDREAAETRSKKDAETINAWQDKLFAERKRALLVVLQGTDTSGKDGTIRHVFNSTISSAADGGGPTWVQGCLTWHGWAEAAEFALVCSALGGLVGLAVWRTAYRWVPPADQA